MKVTEHFDVDEFRCRDGTPYPAEWTEKRLRPLCELLELLRAELGAPIEINSGYRTPEYNARLEGAASRSQHCEGRAADIVVRGYSPAAVQRRVLDMYRAGRLPMLGGLGCYQTFTHVDVRPRPHPQRIAQWYGTRTSNVAGA